MANKKVNQLTTKPAVNSTDLFLIADPTSGQAFKSTISSLGAAIGSAVASVNGLIGVVVLDTDDIQELASPTNKWFTDTRARAALSAGTGISYNSGTGVITNAVTSGQISTALGYTPANDSLVVKLSGNQTISGNLTATSFIKSGGLSTEFLMADGSVSTGITFTYPGAGIAVSTGSAWGTSITDNSSNWNTAYSWGNHAGLYLPIGGGTLTGTLNGTAANFAGNLLLTNVNPTLSFNTTTTVNTTMLQIIGAQFVGSAPYNANRIVGFQQSHIALEAGGAEVMRITSGGNVAIGTTTDSGFKLDVTGTARVTGAATFSSSVTATSFVRVNGSSAAFLKADGSIDLRSFVTEGALDNYLPLTGGSLTNSLSSGYVLSVTNTTEAANANGLYVNIASGSTGTPFRVDRGGVSLITVNYLGATLFKSSVTANSFIKADGTSSQFLKADGSVDNNTYVSSSALSGYLPLTGGTLTGALSGTSATFSSSITAGSTSSGAQINVYASSYGSNGLFNAYGTDGNIKLQMGGLGTNEAFIYTGASNKLSIFTGGNTSMTITSAGNVGIGLTNPSAKLHVEVAVESPATGAVALIAKTSNGNNDIFRWYDGSTQLGVFKNSGNVGIGTTSPGAKLEVVDSGGSQLLIGYGGVGANYYDATNHYFRGTNGGGNRMTITSGGNVGIGITPFANTIAQSLDMAAGAGMFGYSDQNYLTGNLYFNSGWKAKAAGNGSIINLAASINFFTTTTGSAGGAVSLVSAMTIASSGAITCGFSVTASSFFESSDKTIKTLIEDNYQAKGIESVTAKLYLKNGVQELGYYAQDVQPILPSAVSKGENGLLNLSYREVHTAKIARLEKRVEELEAQLNLI